MRRVACLLMLAAFASIATAQTRDRNLRMTASDVAAGEPRHALVIGNSAYTHGSLKNAVNDARAMAKALAAAGFNVRLLEDASLIGMQRAVRQWGNDLAAGGVGLFYYAGHGMQVKGRNYLVPVNAEIELEDEIEFNSLDVNQVLAKMDSAKNAVNIVILDACRNNPFARSFRVSASGLAQMDAPTGTFIAFATAPGSTASDGVSGDNGVYTRHLLREMPSAGLPIEQVFKRVRNGVMADTKGLQVPWESSSLRGEFAFIPGKPAQDMLAEAVADAVRREREANQQRMDQLIREALERQRAQFEQQAVKLAAAPPAPRPSLPPSPTPPAPIVTAALAPGVTASAVARARLPQPGDHWTYRLIETNRGGRTQQWPYDVRVLASSPGAILDRFSFAGSEGDWAHENGGYLLSQAASVFSPYLDVFEELKIGKSLPVRIMDAGCTGYHVCDASAKVAGREKVTVPAGTFDTVKVVVEHLWMSAAGAGVQINQAGQMNGARVLTVWYAPSVKRAVKFTSRRTFGEIPPIEPNFDLELVSYQLK